MYKEFHTREEMQKTNVSIKSLTGGMYICTCQYFFSSGFQNAL